jgi:hypothetical protein
MTNKTKHLGIGATVSFGTKFLHPHIQRDEKFPYLPHGHRLKEALVVGRERKLINHKETTCVIVHHNDFKDNEGRFYRLWCAESHVTVEKEGDPDKFFEHPENKGALVSDSVASDTDKTTDDDKHLSDADDEEEENIAEPLATAREVLSFIPNTKTKIFFGLGLFFGMCSGIIFPAMAWIFSGSFSDLSANASTDDYMKVCFLAFVKPFACWCLNFSILFCSGY